MFLSTSCPRDYIWLELLWPCIQITHVTLPKLTWPCPNSYGLAQTHVTLISWLLRLNFACMTLANPQNISFPVPWIKLAIAGNFTPSHSWTVLSHQLELWRYVTKIDSNKLEKVYKGSDKYSDNFSTQIPMGGQNIVRNWLELGVVVHIFNPCTGEAKIGRQNFVSSRSTWST